MAVKACEVRTMLRLGIKIQDQGGADSPELGLSCSVDRISRGCAHAEQVCCFLPLHDHVRRSWFIKRARQRTPTSTTTNSRRSRRRRHSSTSASRRSGGRDSSTNTPMPGARTDDARMPGEYAAVTGDASADQHDSTPPLAVRSIAPFRVHHRQSPSQLPDPSSSVLCGLFCPLHTGGKAHGWF